MARQTAPSRLLPAPSSATAAVTRLPAAAALAVLAGYVVVLAAIGVLVTTLR
jgi:hypothetical protein